MSASIVPHSDWVARQLDRKIEHLGRLRDQYRDLFDRMTGENPVEQELARQSIVQLWNQIQANLGGRPDD